jgi:hypothetical protein
MDIKKIQNDITINKAERYHLENDLKRATSVSKLKS